MQETIKHPKSVIPRAWCGIALLMLLATALNLYQLGTESVWIDEIFSLVGAQSFNWTEPHVRPLYFILLRFWMRFGESDAGLRGLSVLFSVSSVFLIQRLGRRMLGNSIGWVAAVMMTLSPLFINHAQEIRMYSLSVFLSLLGTLALAEAFDRPSWRAISLWSLARAGAAVTTPLNILLLFPDILLCGWKFYRRRRWWLAVGSGFLFIGVVFLPSAWLLTFGSKAEEFFEGPTPPTLGLARILTMPLQFTVGWPMKYLLAPDQAALEPGETTYLSLAATSNLFSVLLYGLATVILLGLLGVALISLLKQNRSEKLLAVAAWALIPTAGILFVSYVKSSIWVPRYLLFIAPYFILLMAFGFIWVWQHWRRVALGMAAVYLVAVGGGLRSYYTILYRNDWKGVAQVLSDNQQSGDTIVYHSVDRFKDQSLLRYYRGATPIQFLDKQITTPNLNSTEVEQSLGIEIPIRSRLWLVCWLTCEDKPETDRILETLVGNEFQIVDRDTFTSIENMPIEVFLIEPESPVPLPKSSSTPPSSL
ncbi:MAG: glycosyltransferase family 39 protein [Geitlerinemataceae cyanobacterium]